MRSVLDGVILNAVQIIIKEYVMHELNPAQNTLERRWEANVHLFEYLFSKVLC